MGNQVVVSISYDHLDELENRDFGELARQIHESPSIPRFYNGKAHKRMALFDEECAPGIAFSHYSHASDGVVVAVSSQGITQPSMAFALTSKDIEGGRLSILKKFKQSSKYMLNEPHSVRKSKALTAKPDPDKHHRCLVVGYLTDNSHALYEDPSTLPKIVAHMRDPEANALPYKIKRIGNVEVGEQILVKMHGNCFISSEPYPSGNDMTFEKWSSDMSFDERGRMAPKESDRWVCARMMNGLGYDLTPMNEKTQESDSDAEPER